MFAVGKFCVLVLLSYLFSGGLVYATPGDDQVIDLFNLSGGREKGLDITKVQTSRSYPVKKPALAELRRKPFKAIRIPVDGSALTFMGRSRKVRYNGILSWSGTTEDQSASIVLTTGRDHLFGRVQYQGETITYQPDMDGTEVVVRKLDPSMAVFNADDMRIPPGEASEYAQEMAAPLTKDRMAVAQPAGGEITIDVMVLYTSGMASQYGDTVDTKIQHLVDLANEAFVNSAVATRYRLVHSQEVRYPDENSMAEALDDLSDHRGVFLDVGALRNQYGADQVTLLRRYVDREEGCGLAWVMQDRSFAFPYAVVHQGNLPDLSGYYCSDLSYAHELGHNLGCAHDVNHAYVHGFSEHFSYGYQHPEGEFRTLMAYNCEGGCDEITHFSNPDVTWSGFATGVAEAADNARTIELTSATVAALKVATAPEIVLSHTRYDFGTVQLNEDAVAQAFYVSNEGGGYLEIGELARATTAPFTISQETCSNNRLAAGEHCIIYADLQPAQPGSFSGSLTIESNDLDESLVVVELTATVTSTAPFISLNLESHDFIKVNPGTVVGETFIITNLGDQELELGRLGGRVSLQDPFSLESDTCSTAKLTTQTSCSFIIRYAPESTSLVRGSLDVPSNDPATEELLLRVEGGAFPWQMFYHLIQRQEGMETFN